MRAAAPTSPSDAVLVEQFVDHGDEQAFAKVVSRRAAMVLAAAERRAQAGVDPRDVAQAAFIMLARRPRSAARSARRTGGSVTPWLLKVLGYAAANAVLSAARRRKHEAAAGSIVKSSADPSEVIMWHEIAPQLDDAILSLSKADQTIVTLRYFDDVPVAKIAERLGIAKDAAKQRVSRATRRLRDQLRRRGVVVSTATLTSLLALHASTASTTITAAVLTATALSPTAGTAGLTLAQGGLAMMTLTKLKLGAAVAATLTIGGTMIGGDVLADAGPTTAPAASTQPQASDPVPPTADEVAADFDANFLPPDGRVIERTLTMERQYLDLDTGETYADVDFDGGAQADVIQVAWDAVLARSDLTPGISTFDSVAVPVVASAWELPVAAIEVANLWRWNRETWHRLDAIGSLPRTFIFRTRSGSGGVLQITDVTPGDDDLLDSLQLRYRILTHGEGESVTDLLEAQREGMKRPTDEAELALEHRASKLRLLGQEIVQHHLDYGAFPSTLNDLDNASDPDYATFFGSFPDTLVYARPQPFDPAFPISGMQVMLLERLEPPDEAMPVVYVLLEDGSAHGIRDVDEFEKYLADLEERGIDLP